MSSTLASRQRGLSLIEMMIAIALGMVITLALTSLYTDVSSANRELAKTNAKIENARFAMQLMRNDLVHAGYWGGFVPEFDELTYVNVPSDTPTIVPDPCLAFASWTSAYKTAVLGTPVQVDDGVPGTCGAIVTDKVAGTDVLVVRRAQTCVAGVGTCPAEVAGKVYFQHSNCESEIDGGSPYVFGNAGFTLKERDCGLPGGDTPSGKRLYTQTIYYIRDYLQTAGDGIPTLMRSEFGLTGTTPTQQPAQPLVDGLEMLRVELGVDSLSDTGAAVDYSAAIVWADSKNWNSPTNRGDGVPDGAWQHCTSCGVSDFMNTVAVKLHVLAKASEPSAGYIDKKTYKLGSLNVSAFNDNYMRHVFSTTVRLNSVSGRRETP